VTDGMILTLLPASLQHKTCDQLSSMPNRVKLKIIAYHLRHVTLNWKLSCTFSSHITAKLCKKEIA